MKLDMNYKCEICRMPLGPYEDHSGCDDAKAELRKNHKSKALKKISKKKREKAAKYFSSIAT